MYTRDCNKAIHKYIKTIKRNLPISTKNKKNIMTQFESGIREYINENPQYTIHDIYEEFGSAEEVVAALQEELPPDTTILHYHIKRLILSLFIILLILGILAISSTTLISYYGLIDTIKVILLHLQVQLHTVVETQPTEHLLFAISISVLFKLLLMN